MRGLLPTSEILRPCARMEASSSGKCAERQRPQKVASVRMSVACAAPEAGARHEQWLGIVIALEDNDTVPVDKMISIGLAARRREEILRSVD